MGRKRLITADQILDATAYVVGRDGAAQLTLDAVAVQAKISKATVLYCYGSKDELIEAVVRRGVAMDTAFNDAAIASLGDTPNAVIHGRLLAAKEVFPAEWHPVALSLCSALAQDAKLRSVQQDTQTAVMDRIKKTSAKPRGAMLAYLALEGLKLLEILEWHVWSKPEREELLRDIAWLAETEPPRSKPRQVRPPTKQASRNPRRPRKPEPNSSPATKPKQALHPPSSYS